MLFSFTIDIFYNSRHVVMQGKTWDPAFLGTRQKSLVARPFYEPSIRQLGIESGRGSYLLYGWWIQNSCLKRLTLWLKAKNESASHEKVGAGRHRVQWDDSAPVTPLGQLVFFAQFLHGWDHHAPLPPAYPAILKLSLRIVPMPLFRHQPTRDRDNFNSPLATMCSTLAASVW